ncbi:Heavy metal transport/detoxification superfamily protein [Raphanus sativus]|nr:Heavy metal transport/detoxification superfamily protein [Raphanus sativus]
MHCDSCASKIVKSVRAFQGVETVKAESETGKVTVTGVVDPAKLREQLEVKTKKKVELAPVTTVVLKVDFHCEGCIEKIQKTASKTKGVSGLSLDHEKQLVTVKGTMDVKKLAESLTRKLKRDVEIKRGGGRGKDNAGDKGGEGMNTMEHVAAQPAHGSMYDPDEDGYSNQFYAVARDLLSDENPNCVVM